MRRIENLTTKHEVKRSAACRLGLLLFPMACCTQVLAQSTVPKQAVIEVSFELIRGAIILPATLNGSGPIWMMLDTKYRAGEAPTMLVTRPRYPSSGLAP